MAGMDEFHGRSQGRAQVRVDPAPCRLVDQIAFVQDDHIGAVELVLEDLLQRVVVVEHGIGPALGLGRLQPAEALRSDG